MLEMEQSKGLIKGKFVSGTILDTTLSRDSRINVNWSFQSFAFNVHHARNTTL